MVNVIRARPTIYKGVQMRSRLEARWAAVFDHLGIAWSYEPVCFADEEGQYLPDFVLPGFHTTVHGIHWRSDVYVEVKPPTVDVGAEWRRCAPLWTSKPDAILLLCCSEVPADGVIIFTEAGLRLGLFKRCEPAGHIFANHFFPDSDECPACWLQAHAR